MTVVAFRVQNFMAFEDSGWVKLCPLTLFFGRNSSGKSALLKALLLLKQSLWASGSDPFLFRSERGIDGGTYASVIHEHVVSRTLSVGFQCAVPEKLFNYLSATSVREETIIAIEVDFRLNMASKQLELHRMAISIPDRFDQKVHGEMVFEALKREGDGKLDWWFGSDFLEDHLRPNKRNIWPYVSIVMNPDIQFIPMLYLEIDPRESATEDWGQDFIYVCLLLDTLTMSIKSFLESIIYLGSIRPVPERYYRAASGDRSYTLDSGATIMRRLAELMDTSADAKTKIDSWLATLGFPVGIDVVRLHAEPKDTGVDVTDLFQVSVSGPAGLKVNLNDVGFGISQVLPIIIAGLIAESQSVILLEQPELHLHPEAQANLGDLLIEMSHKGITFLVETHSEHLLLRLQRRIAETGYEDMIAARRSPRLTTKEWRRDAKSRSTLRNDGFSLRSDSFSLVHVLREANISMVEMLSLDHRGKIVNPSLAFQDFFKQDYEDVRLLISATSEILQLEAKL